ncbi:hypothetical protein [Brucella melitensis]|uniref:hypothetical protein n=1 Tax=Brucella melitensis TaxID=29459 RepID=UPI0032C1BAD5
MSNILKFTALANAPFDRLASGLLDSHCDNGLAVIRTIYEETRSYSSDQHFYIKGGTLGALCVRMNNDAQQIVELTRELDKERSRNRLQQERLDRQAHELVDLKGENERLKNSYAIASDDRADLENRLKGVTSRLAEWVMWSVNVLGHEEPNNELQRAAIDRLHVRAGENLKGVREHRDELLQQLANVNLELNNYKQLVEAMKSGTAVDQSTIKHHAEHICRLSEEAEELKEDRALASGQLENWRTVARSILDVHFHCYPVSHIGDKELRDLLAHEVEQLASKHKQLISDHGTLRNAAQSYDLQRRGLELDIQELKSCNERQGETIRKYQGDADELKRWQQWALVQFGLQGADHDIRDGIDSFLCSSATDREAWFLECGRLKDEVAQLKKDLERADKQRDEILKYRDDFIMRLRRLLEENNGVSPCGYESMFKAFSEALNEAAQERIERRRLADIIARLFNTGVKSSSLAGIGRSIEIIRKQMDEFGERAEKAKDELEKFKQWGVKVNTMECGGQVISMGEPGTIKAEHFAIAPMDIKVHLSDEMREAVVDAIVDNIKRQDSAIIAAIKNK